MLPYSRLSYQLPNDTYVTKHTRRCVKPKYDNGREKYNVAPSHEIRVVRHNHPLFYPYNERLCSPMMKMMRMPNLHEYHWQEAEEFCNTYEYPTGARIQIYSIINTINQKAIYYIERLDHPTIRWKRIIMSFHLSEICLFLPHYVEEIPLRSPRNKIDSCSCLST
jgi:hypothetical protein